MANWSDPQPNASSFRTVDVRSDAFDAGLRRYMLSVYNYMASGVLLTGIVALLFVQSGYAATVFSSGGFLPLVLVFSPLAIVLAMSFGQGRMQTGTLKTLFWAYAGLMGLSLSVVLLRYTGSSVAQAFFATAGAFAGLSLYGYTTKRDLAPFGTFLIMGVVGLVVAMVINMFVNSGPFGLVISLVGVLLFAGLTAYHTQRTKSLYAHVAGTDMEDRVVVMSALQLYLDFINMFLFLLRLFGSQRN